MNLRASCIRCRALAFLCAATVGPVAVGQVGTYPYPSGTSSPTTSSPLNTGNSRSIGNDVPTMDPNLSHRQMISRRDDQKRRMVENSARLLMLTRELQADLQGREPNDGDAKRLDEIAKLARSVRDQMRQ